MLRRNTRRKRSRTRTRGTELTVENVIDIWKSETFQKEHGESKEKIEKIINFCLLLSSDVDLLCSKPLSTIHRQKHTHTQTETCTYTDETYTYTDRNIHIHRQKHTHIQAETYTKSDL